MARVQEAVPSEFWAVEPRRNIAFRLGNGLKAFAHRKPLGAAGGLLVALILAGALLLPGLDVGLIQLPQLTRYSVTDAELGQDILEGPSSDHLTFRHGPPWP